MLFGLIAGINGRADSFDQVFTRASLMATAIGAFAGISGWMVARRSKLLWLRCGLDRLELFRLCEREAWKSFVATAIGALLLLPLVWLRSASNGLEYTLLLMFQLCSGACLLYLGLTWVRGWRAVDVLSGLVFFIAWGAASVSTPFLAEHWGWCWRSVPRCWSRRWRCGWSACTAGGASTGWSANRRCPSHVVK